MENCKDDLIPEEEGKPVCPDCGQENPAEEAALPQAAEETEEAAEAAETAPEEETAAEAAPAEEPAEEAAPADNPAEAAPAEEAAGTEMKPGIVVSPVAIIAVVAVVLVLVAALGAMIFTGRSKSAPAQTQPETVEQSAPAEDVPETEATVPEDGNPDDVTCRGSYTASDEEVVAQGDTVVAAIGKDQLTNRELQVYYWLEVRQFLNQYGAYAAYFGLDANEPLDTQPCAMVEGLTWQQYFLQEALQTWRNYQAMSNEAEANAAPMDPEHQAILDSITDEMTQNAVENGIEDADALVRMSLGAGADMESYHKYLSLYYRGYGYFAKVQSEMDISDAEVEAYFAANAEEYAESGLTKDTCTVDVRHILIYPEGATAENARTETFSDEAWAAGEENAKKILAQWEKGDRTEESFAALANEKSGDPGSNTNGGLYTGVSQGQMVEAFDSWCFDPQRQVGDTGIVKTEFGYHIMYFSGRHTLWQETAANDLLAERSEKLLNDAVEKYTMEADYAAMKLAEVKLG